MFGLAEQGLDVVRVQQVQVLVVVQVADLGGLEDRYQVQLAGRLLGHRLRVTDLLALLVGGRLVQQEGLLPTRGVLLAQLLRGLVLLEQVTLLQGRLLALDLLSGSAGSRADTLGLAVLPSLAVVVRLHNPLLVGHFFNLLRVAVQLLLSLSEIAAIINIISFILTLFERLCHLSVGISRLYALLRLRNRVGSTNIRPMRLVLILLRIS